MKIGWVGLGKLGMPCALSLALAHHEVIGVDPDPVVAKAVETRQWPHDEPGVSELLRAGLAFDLGTVDDLADVDVVFVAVQTPHAPGFDGSAPMPEERKPFDTSFLVGAVRQVDSALCRAGNVEAPIAIVSTVLPGTCKRQIEPELDGRPFAYCPAFVAMGSVLADLDRPEFVLLGLRDERAKPALLNALGHAPAPFLTVRVESAELAKMAYNTAISQKIVLANALMELADATGADVDEVSDVLQAATQRVASGRYLRAGMGDGGPCHPRDGIAMAWVAEEARLSADPFAFAVRAREAQARRLARRVGELAVEHCLPVVVVGRAYKAGVSIEAGSAALLVAHYLEAAGHPVMWHDPLCGYTADLDVPAVFLRALPDRALPVTVMEGSVVVDPWGVVVAEPGVVRVGRR